MPPPAPPVTPPELARVLAAHTAWIASGARSGARADLTGRSLAGLDLTAADRRLALVRITPSCDTVAGPVALTPTTTLIGVLARLVAAGLPVVRP